ncbi:MAG: substrate-binding domain-containing protein [Pseudomonadota bacterium]
MERRVDGMILTGGEHDPRVFRTLERHGIPCVLTWRQSENAAHPSVSFDNYAAGLLAMKKLVALGHRRIGLICGRTDVNDRAEKRWRAYVDVLKSIDVEIDPHLIFERDFEFIEGHTAMVRMIENPDPPTAVFAANDIQAIGAIAGCREKGLNVPDDISIIGFDDLPIAQFSHPKLTTVHVPAADMGHLAATRLFQQINGEMVTGSDILPVKLVERDSATSPKSG